MLHRQRVVIHLQATFFTTFGKPINQFLTGLQVDIVPKGKRRISWRPMGHSLVNGNYIGSRKLLIVMSLIYCNGGKAQVLSWVCQTSWGALCAALDP